MDYKNGKIYKIVDNTNGNIYIGSTCQPLCKRIAKHKSNYNDWIKDNEKNNFVSSFKILENGDYQIILIEEYPCENKEQLRMREQYYKDNNNCINHINAYTSKEYKQEYKKDWYNNNIDILKEKSKQWRENNKEKLKEYFKNHYENNKETIKEKVKNWYDNNIEHKKEYDKNYYEKNKERIQQRDNIQVLCECGLMSSKSNLTRHKKTLKHQNFLNNLN